VGELPSPMAQGQEQLICLFHSTLLFKQLSTFSFDYRLSRNFQLL